MTLKKKPSAAAKVRAALDPKPPQIADDPALQRQRELSVVEAARPPPADVRLLSAAMVMSKVGISWPTLWVEVRQVSGAAPDLDQENHVDRVRG